MTTAWDAPHEASIGTHSRRYSPRHPRRPGRLARGSVGQVLRDYYTLTKPSIILLLLVTTVPAMFLAAGGWPGTAAVLATLLGGMIAAGGAGAVNMYVDRDIDAVMLRTRRRPIPAGRVSARSAADLRPTCSASGPGRGSGSP
jgi:heme o synthase